MKRPQNSNSNELGKLENYAFSPIEGRQPAGLHSHKEGLARAYILRPIKRA